MGGGWVGGWGGCKERGICKMSLQLESMQVLRGCSSSCTVCFPLQGTIQHTHMCAAGRTSSTSSGAPGKAAKVEQLTWDMG